MPKESAEIPILGLDNRLLQRQNTPGLCSDITNLRPRGIEDDPYWEAIPAPNQLTNSTGTAFSHAKQGQIADGFYRHATVGKRRLVLVFDDGSLDVIDPDGDGAWEVLTSYSFGSTGNWEADFAEVGEILAMAISRGGEPFWLGYLFRDEIIPYGFPVLPAITMNQKVNSYTESEIDAGTHTGLRDGHYAWRYGFRVSGYYTVAISPPFPFEVDNDDGSFSEIEFVLGGYNTSNAPDKLDFWKRFLNGINVYISGRHTDKHNLLIDGLYYNVVSFDSISKQLDWPGSDNPNIQTYEGITDEISTNELFEVGGGGHHRLYTGSLYAYNERLIMGRVAVDFAEPLGEIDSGIAEGVTMSPVERTVESLPVQGDPFETYRLVEYEFRLTAVGGVLPDDEVSIINTVDVHSVFKDQVDDQNVDVIVRYDESQDEDRQDTEFDVVAQAYTDMEATEAVGEEFNFSYPEDLQ